MTMGEKIQDLRKRSGMSQDLLAEQLEVSRQAVSKWERDEALPEADHIVRIAKLFHVTTDYLLMDEPAPQVSPSPQQSSPGANAFWKQLERFARRHGYKGGFILCGSGALVCALFLGMRAIANNMASSMMSSFQSFTGGLFGGFGSGLGDTPGFGSMADGFQQTTNAITGMASNMGDIFLIGLIPGIAMIAAGIAVVIIGRKYAREMP